MAMEQVQGILEGLKIAQARRADNFKVQQEVANRAQQNEQFQNDLKLRQDELAQRKNQFDVTTKAAKAMHDLQMLQEEQNLGKSLQEGNNVPGATSTPGADANHVVYQIPGIDNPLTLLTPEAYRTKQIQDITAKDAPVHANRMEEIATQSQNAKDLAAQNKTDALVQMQQMQDYENKRAATHEAAENFRTQTEVASREHVAKIQQGLEGLTPDMLDPYIHQVVNGDLTQKQLNALPLPKGVKAAIVNGVTSSGGAVLNDNEQDVIKSFTPIKQIIGKLDQYNDIIKANPTLSRIPGTDAYKQTSLLSEEIEGILPNVARVIATDTGRLSNQQIQMVKGMTEPSKNFLTNDSAINEKRRNDFLGITNALIDSKLSRLPEGQRAAVKQKLGITDIPMRGKQSTGPSHLFFDAQGNQIQQPGITQ